MIHYHGTPITPASAAMAILRGRHAMVSFACQQQVALAFEIYWSADQAAKLPGGYATPRVAG